MTDPISFYTSSRGIFKQSDLSLFLDSPVCLLSDLKFGSNHQEPVCLIGWGNKPNTAKIKAVASKYDLPFCRLEDGFLGYFGHPSSRHIRVGLIKDTQGIYYDAFGKSDLESFIQQPLKRSVLRTAKKDLDLFTSLKLSKYNDPKISETPENIHDDYVLLIDQTFGDQSINSGGANQDCFLWMLLDALNLYPDSKIIIRTHPDVKAGKKKGCFNKKWLSLSSRIELNDAAINAVDLIKPAQAVFCVTSQMGFESILHDKKVFTYSTAFYTGYDLSDDRILFLSQLDSHQKSAYFDSINLENTDLCFSQFESLIDVHSLKRKHRLSDHWDSLNLESKKISLFYASMDRYCTYVHPDSRKICTFTEILTWFQLQSNFKIDTQKPIIMYGFSLWKKWFIPAFIPFNQRENLLFISNEQALSRHLNIGYDVVITWGAIRADKVRLLSTQRDIKVICVEDGFIRSQGLGVDLKRPSSLCFDDLSIYYNSIEPSQLNSFLNSHPALNDETHAQTLLLMNLIRKNDLSKYNVGQLLDNDTQVKINHALGLNKEIILIPGQVMGDASLKYGTSKINTNAKLISQVKLDYPDAFIIYKPHPDVFASSKGDFTELKTANTLCDLVLSQENIALLYPLINRLCTMTSLSGFEALLRGVTVDCYGQPFYSGWGLTVDHLNINHRDKTLSLEQLVHTTLINYPLYVNWKTWTFMHPEILVEQISTSHVKIKPTGFFIKMRTKINYLFELYKMRRSRY